MPTYRLYGKPHLSRNLSIDRGSHQILTVAIRLDSDNWFRRWLALGLGHLGLDLLRQVLGKRLHAPDGARQLGAWHQVLEHRAADLVAGREDVGQRHRIAVDEGAVQFVGGLRQASALGVGQSCG